MLVVGAGFIGVEWVTELQTLGADGGGNAMQDSPLENSHYDVYMVCICCKLYIVYSLMVVPQALNNINHRVV